MRRYAVLSGVALVLLLWGGTDAAQAPAPAAPGVRLSDPRAEVKALMELGAAYTDTQRFAMALEQFHRILALDSTYAPAHYGLGRVYAMQERYEEAKQALMRAIQLAPNFADAYTLLSFVDEAMEDKPGALTALERAVELMQANEAKAALQADELTLLRKLERRLEKLRRQKDG